VGYTHTHTHTHTRTHTQQRIRKKQNKNKKQTKFTQTYERSNIEPVYNAEKSIVQNLITLAVRCAQRAMICLCVSLINRRNGKFPLQIADTSEVHIFIGTTIKAAEM
jgi:hypothetical protein